VQSLNCVLIPPIILLRIIIVFEYLGMLLYSGNKDLDLLSDLICPCCGRKNFSVKFVGTYFVVGILVEIVNAYKLAKSRVCK
jgi:hypothetical protein